MLRIDSIFRATLLIIPFICVALTAAQNEKRSIAIADFHNNTGRFANDRLEQAIPEMLKTELAQTGAVNVVERDRLQAVFNEQALGQSGNLDPMQAQQVGKLVGAQYVISGELTLTGGRFRVDAHVVRVETAEVVGEKVSGPTEKAIESMIHILAQNIANNLTGQGRPIMRSAVHNYPYRYTLLCAAGTGIAAGIFQGKYQNDYGRYRSSTNLDDISRSYDAANSNYHTRNILLGATLVTLTTTLVLWLEDRSEANMILSYRQGMQSGKFCCSPIYNPRTNSFGFQVCWVY